MCPVVVERQGGLDLAAAEVAEKFLRGVDAFEADAVANTSSMSPRMVRQSSSA